MIGWTGQKGNNYETIDIHHNHIFLQLKNGI